MSDSLTVTRSVMLTREVSVRGRVLSPGAHVHVLRDVDGAVLVHHEVTPVPFYVYPDEYREVPA